MRTIRQIAGFLVLCFFSVHTALAADEVVMENNTSSGEEVVSLRSPIDIVAVQGVAAEGKIVFSAQLKNTTATELHARVGAEFYQINDDPMLGGRLAYSVAMGDVLTLRAMSEQSVEVTTPIPSLPAGKYRVAFGVSEDRPVSTGVTKLALEVDIQSERSLTLKECRLGDMSLDQFSLKVAAGALNQVDIRCRVDGVGDGAAQVTAVARLTDRKYSSEPVIGKQVTNISNEEELVLPVTISETPGSYVLEVVLMDEEGVVLGLPVRTRLVLSGQGGNIERLTELSGSFKQGEEWPLLVTVRRLTDDPVVVRARLVSAGEECTKPFSESVVGNAVEGKMSMAIDCPMPILTVTLETPAGEVLDTVVRRVESNPAVQSVIQTPSPIRSWNWPAFVVGGLVVLVILGLVFRRVHMVGPALLLMFVGWGVFGWNTHDVKAVSWQLWSNSCQICMDTWVNLTVEPMKTTFNPGEEIKLHITVSPGDRAIGMLDPYISLRNNTTGMSSGDLFPSTYPMGDYDLLDVATGVMAPASGTFSINITGGLGGYSYGTGGQPPAYTQGGLSVTAPPAPLPNLNTWNDPAPSFTTTSTVIFSGFVYNSPDAAVAQAGRATIDIDWNRDGSFATYSADGGVRLGAMSANSNKLIGGPVPGISNPPAGNHRFRFNADTQNEVAESNESDNTGAWVNFTVTAPAWGTFMSAADCYIAAGQAGCNTTIDWQTGNLTQATATLTNCANTFLASGNGFQRTGNVYVPYGTGCYRIHDGGVNGTVLATTNLVRASCAVGTTWNNTICQANVALGITLNDFSPNRITVGQTSSITWTSTGVPPTRDNGGGCTANPQHLINGLVPSSRPAPGTFPAINTPGTYTQQITCTDGVGGSVTSVVRTLIVDPVAAPTARITASLVTAYEQQSLWKKIISFITGRDHVAQATGPDVTISSTGSARIDWTASGGASNCTISGPQMLPATSLTGSRSFSAATLGAGTTNTYTISCNNGAATDSVRIIVSAAPPTGGGCCNTGDGGDTPSGLTATAGACNTDQITLSWGSVSGATSYQLRDGSTIIYNGASTSYVHTASPAGSSHSYSVRATGLSGSGSYSGTVNRDAPSTCAVTTYTVTVTAGPGGSISPIGPVIGVVAGGSQSFTISPSTGYARNDVRVDNVSVGALGNYTFSNVTANHTISATFSAITGPRCRTPMSNNASVYAGDDTGLSVDTQYTYSATNTSAKCQYFCNNGFSWDGNECASTSGFICTGTRPANTSMWSSGDTTNLIQNVSYRWSASNTARKCEYHCRAGYTWDLATQTCDGPSVSLSASSASIIAGNSSTLTWTPSVDVTSCWASGGGAPWTNTWVAPTGGNMPVSPLVTTTYSIECWNASGISTGIRNRRITVIVPAAPSATLTVGTCQIADNASTCLVPLSWTSADLTGPASIRQDGVEFDTNPIVLPTANLTRPMTHVAAGGSTFTFVHNGSDLDTASVGATCAGATAFWDGTICATACVPNDTCDDHATEISNTCVGSDYTFTDALCGQEQNCPGTRSCDYNWKEVSP